MPTCPHCKSKVFLTWKFTTSDGEFIMIYCSNCKAPAGAIDIQARAITQQLLQEFRKFAKT